jgi:hypothetical protein
MTQPRRSPIDQQLRSARVPPQEEGRCCCWPGCGQEAGFRAPRSRTDLREFVWFCLEHVRLYNQSWDYFGGMSQDEIEAHRRADVTWHRPSWRFGLHGWTSDHRVHDGFGFFEDEPPQRPAGAPLDPRAQAMIGVMGLEPGYTLAELKRQYKVLAKRHHPDLHGGDKNEEERLKRINEAYRYLIDNELYA